MDQKLKNTTRFIDFQLYKDYSSNQKSTLQMIGIKSDLRCLTTIN